MNVLFLITFMARLTYNLMQDIEDEIYWDTNYEYPDDIETNSMNELFNYNDD